MTLSIHQLRVFAEKWLKETYNLELTVPLNINGRLKKSCGRFVYMRYADGRKKAKAVEINRYFLENNSSDVVIDVLKHELVHFALFTLGKPHSDGHPHFENELRRLGVISQSTADKYNFNMKKIKRSVHLYQCCECKNTYTLRKALKHQGIYHRCKCGGRLEDKGKMAV